MIAAETSRAAGLLDQPHHDGSEAYVREVPDEPGGEATVLLRVPRAVDVEHVLLRYVRDGEPRSVVATVDEQTDAETWWRASFPVWNPACPYRWLLAGGDAGWAWVNGRGIVGHDVPDAEDFVLTLDAGGPAWHLTSVVYEIFPDRFARGGLAVEPLAWAVPRGWDELPTGRGPETSREWFGGDLPGVEQRLDHIERLGANVVYLTPIFPATSTHRYDATTFDRVDPLLGGDAALASLLASAHARGMRVVGDLTTNHTGSEHDWFRAALADPESPERSFYLFDGKSENGYESFYGVPTLPKLDWRSHELRRRMQAVARRWVDEGLDGWRIDVANMTGRWRDVDVNAEVARALRSALPDGALVVAEHFHDARPDRAAFGWHGVMNYAGFLKPVWTWLRGDDPGRDLRSRFHDLLAPMPRLPGTAAVETMRAFAAGVPWTSTLHSWALLDSHDTARFRTVAGSRERELVGRGLQMTTPGVPMIFAGDEIGLEGEWGEDARRPMPWERPESWDTALLEAYRRLIALRRSSDALARGGVRWAWVGEDALAYLREAPGERLLCLAARAAHEPVRLSLQALGCRELEPVVGGEAVVRAGQVHLPADGPAFNVWRLIDG